MKKFSIIVEYYQMSPKANEEIRKVKINLEFNLQFIPRSSLQGKIGKRTISLK